MSASTPLIPVSTGRAHIMREAGPYRITLMEHTHDIVLERHRHREAIIGLLMRGRYDERLENRTVEPERASLLIKPPETPHANRIGREGTDTILIQVLPGQIPDEHASLLSRPGIRLDSRFFALGQQMLAELDASAVPLGLEALVAELLFVASDRGPVVGRGRSPRQAWITRLRDRLHDSAELPSLTELSADAGTDRAHLARTFRAVFGCTIGEYVRALRMVRAARRLADPHVSLSAIALELGFCDQAHFTRTFRSTYGMPPDAWRRAHSA